LHYSTDNVIIFHINSEEGYMKKISSLILTLVVIMISGCSNQSSKDWTNEDFSLYDFDGNESLFPTIDDYYITTYDEDDKLKTKRDIALGDRAVTALKKYNLKDFEYEIYGARYIGLKEKTDKSVEKAKQFNEEYHDKYKTAEDVLEKIDQICANDLYIYFYCDIYKQNKELCTYSELSSTDRTYVNHHLKYTFSISLKSQ
jgi:hypothetical protein